MRRVREILIAGRCMLFSRPQRRTRMIINLSVVRLTHFLYGDSSRAKKHKLTRPTPSTGKYKVTAQHHDNTTTIWQSHYKSGSSLCISLIHVLSFHQSCIPSIRSHSVSSSTPYISYFPPSSGRASRFATSSAALFSPLFKSSNSD